MARNLPLLTDVIDRIGFGWAQYAQCALGGGVYFADGAEILLIGAVTTALTEEWDLDRHQRANVVSIVFIGVLIGSLLSGPMGDWVGRRCPILLSYLGVGVFSILSAMCQSYIWLVVVRFFVGLTFGLGVPSQNALTTEIAPTKDRLIASLLAAFCFILGEMYSAVLIFIDDPWMRNLHWRWLITMAAIPAFIMVVLGYFFLVEAPAWLALHGHYEKACDVLYTLARCNGKPNLNVEFQVVHITESTSLFTKVSQNLGIILNSNFRYTTFALCFSLFAVNTLYYGGGMYAFVQVLPEISSRLSPGMNLLIGAACEIPGSILAFVLGWYMSRKTSIVTLFMGILITMGSFLLATWMMEKKSDSASGAAETLMQVSFFLFKCLSSANFSFIYLYSVEVYPTRARATGTALCISMGRFGAICSPPLYEWLHHLSGSYHAFFYLMMIICVVSSIFIVFVPFETKGAALKDHEEEVEPVSSSKV